MKVSNIVTTDKLPTWVTEHSFVYSSLEEITNTLPTLIIGWDITKSNYPNTSILDKKISDNLYWTFKLSEKRGEFEHDIKSFIKKSYDDLISKIKTYNIDPLFYKVNSTELFLKKINNLSGSTGYLCDNKVLYIYRDNKIFCVDIELLRFINFDSELVVEEYTKIGNLLNTTIIKKYKKQLEYLPIRYLPFLINQEVYAE